MTVEINGIDFDATEATAALADCAYWISRAQERTGEGPIEGNFAHLLRLLSASADAAVAGSLDTLQQADLDRSEGRGCVVGFCHDR